MSMENNQLSINLLKTGRVNLFDKFIDWALTFGRVVVIGTEVIALCAFLYRFSLDRQLVDLHDQIELKDTYVRALKTNEEKYRNLQERLTLSSTIGKSTTETVTLFKDIIGLAPTDFFVNNLRISQENIRIEASAGSVSSLTYFIDKLKKYPQVETVSLDTIENKTSRATIAVSITAQFKKKL